ncbi:alpha-hydroxy acid oxidase [Afifella sp. IM 167]|uniref:alpha-hydroxy acid oxidase n=1 Tax=Afifella sp. IM 167 TaxID=2033586 RepID=UPI001CCC03FC|nr:alpha-hydroxy acid oxidase [Afifella sp. IM 167]MBZ8134372.1 alpha-hydroxy-acid oxidizing enzyme [Afifella sp. IM 167]
MNIDRTVTAVEDLRILARRRVPRMFYDYVDSGSWSETTYRANARDMSDWGFRQRVAVNIEGRSTATTLLGEPAAMPLALAPAGLAGMQCADGEILAARAALAFGVPFTLSTMSVCSIEDVAEATRRPFWFQLYMMKDRKFMGDLIDRAKAAGCSALVLTLDLPVQGQRHKDIKNGLSTPPKLTIANLVNLLTKPRWCWGMLRTKRRTFGNIVGHAPDIHDTSSMALWVSEQFDQTLDWEAVDWVKARWGGKLILKGIMDPEDARHAVSAGADAIVVSNHGGRQLDGAPASIHALPAIIDAVGNETEVHFDSGVRSGQDVFRAVALGARGAHIGRAYMYGLGALGEDGVARCLSIIKKELDLTMALCGVRKVEEITRDTIVPRN